MTACLRCNRSVKTALADPAVPYVQEFCSIKCAEAGQMVDPTEAECQAMEDAAAAGGEHLDAIGKTDLATLTKEEWMTFIEAVCTGFVESMQNA